VLVRDVMTQAVLTVGPTHTIRQVAEAMRSRHVGAAVVNDPDSEGPASSPSATSSRRWPAARTSTRSSPPTT
jgi:CBS domain-containing protein